MEENVKGVDTTEAVETTNDEILSNVNYKNIIKNLLADGCKKVSGLKIKNVNVTDKDSYTMVSITIASMIDGFVSKDNGVTYEKGKTNNIFTSTFAIAGALKEDEDLAWLANSINSKPEALTLILNGGSVDIIQQEVPAGTEYINPFTTKEDAEPIVYDHDIIINYIVSFHLGKTGQRMADRLADKILGF